MDTSPRPAARYALAAVAITAALATAKVTVWAVTGSLAVLSQALDSVLDILSLGLLYVGLRISAKPADQEHHYGHAKAENLTVFTQTIILGAIVLWVVGGAVTRLVSDGSEVASPWYSFVLLAGSIVIDIARFRWLMQGARDQGSDALRAGALNLATDIGTAAVALASLMFVSLGFERADAVGALIVAAAVAVAAWRLGRTSIDVLMDRAPEARVAAISEAAGRAEGVAETRRVRVRGTSDQLFADITVAAGRTASLERAHDIAEDVEREIARVAPGTDVVVHVEPVSETTGLVERVQAAASRSAGVHEVHNVLVHAYTEESRSKLHVTLHAKVQPGLSLDEAHRLSDAVEDAIARELAEDEGRSASDIRVDTHIEPLQSTAVGAVVTEQNPELVELVRSLALEEPDVLDCHEVIVVTEKGGDLSVVAHVGGRADLPLTRIHDASDRIERAIRAQRPDVTAVTIHFEPV